MANKTAFTMDTKDFDISFKKIMEKTIPGAEEEGLMNMAPFIIRDAIVEEPTVPKSKGITKGGTRSATPGHLRRSQKIEKPKRRHKEVSIEIGFNTPYAAKMHEMPANTNWSTAGSGPKFLETKLVKNKEKYLKMIAETIRKKGK